LGLEGVQADKDGIKLNVFRLAEYGIPYGFSPVLIAQQETLRCLLLPFLTFSQLCKTSIWTAPTHELRTFSNLDGALCMASKASSMTGSPCSFADSAAAP
jgi:hypothetical protein